MMGHLMAVKEKQVYTDDMFVPLRATVELLKTYGQDMSEEIHLQLQVRLEGSSIYTTGSNSPNIDSGDSEEMPVRQTFFFDSMHLSMYILTSKYLAKSENVCSLQLCF